MGLSTVEVFKTIKPEDAVLLSDGQLRELQTTLDGMLADLAECCSRHGLTFFLGGGSCLGAVRHHGFIPWDDDVDVNMPREDHDRFVEIFAREYGDRYWVHTPQTTAGYGLTLSRILLKGTSVRTREDFQNEECGAFIDIFPMENTYDNPLLRRVHGLACMTAGFLQSCAKFKRDARELLKLAESIEDPTQRARCRRIFRIKIRIGRLTAFRSPDGWTRHCDRIYKSCKNRNSVYVSFPSGRGHFFRELYRRSELVPPVLTAYGDGAYPVAADYETYLTRLYGDYRRIPKESEREKHIFFAPFYLQVADNEKQISNMEERTVR